MRGAIYNEIEGFAADWLENLIDAGHIAFGRVDRRSIKDLEPADVGGPGQRHFFAGIGLWQHALRLAGVADADDVWTGSCPCQPFSAAGKRRGVDDERHLWPDWFALIRECRPSIIFGEQVAGAAGVDWLAAVFADLESCGYAVAGADLAAASVGAPHKRQRLFWVAYTNGGVGAQRCEDDRRRLTRGDALAWAGPSGGVDADGLAYDRSKRLENGQQARATAWATQRGDLHLRVDRPWRACDAGCDDLWCDLHEQHAFECPCPTVGGEQATSSMGDTDGDPDRQHAGKLRCDETQHVERSEGGDHRVKRSSANLAPWDRPRWVYCNDPGGARWRPVEAGTFPLAPRNPGDVGRLRAYGNAIVAPLAAEFISSSLEAIGDQNE